MSSGRSVDVLVVGGGILGLCTAWAAAVTARRSVALVERVKIGHAMGSSTGDARMRVLAAYPDDSYVARGIAAGEDWLRAEQAYGRPLLQTTGCLSWGDGQQDLLTGLLRHDLPHDIWAQPDVDRAYPGVSLPPGIAAIHQPDGAIIHADRALTAFAGQASNRDVAIHEGVAATAMRPHRTVRGDREHCRHLVGRAGGGLRRPVDAVSAGNRGHIAAADDDQSDRLLLPIPGSIAAGDHSIRRFRPVRPPQPYARAQGRAPRSRPGGRP